MEYLNFIILTGGVITALICILKVVSIFVHLADDIKETKEIVQDNLPNVKEISTIKDHCFENYMTGLRLTIMSDEMPLGERIVAAQKYIDAGGNGAVKQFIKDELKVNIGHN